ncbi:MAG TPA: hypothetical protein DIV98_11540, partial [Oceanicaulis sp.]|nr:hypothetical protein [Oceanicaulis sp.]
MNPYICTNTAYTSCASVFMDILQILFFAGLAVFLGVRLYMVLGKSSGRTAEDVEREQRERA